MLQPDIQFLRFSDFSFSDGVIRFLLKISVKHDIPGVRSINNLRVQIYEGLSFLAESQITDPISIPPGKEVEVSLPISLHAPSFLSCWRNFGKRSTKIDIQIHGQAGLIMGLPAPIRKKITISAGELYDMIDEKVSSVISEKVNSVLPSFLSSKKEKFS